MARSRLLLALPLLGAGLLGLLLLLRAREDDDARADARRRLLEGESLRELTEGVVVEAGPERATPTALTGRVFGPDGGPVHKAEVRVVYPKTYELVRSGPDGSYELPFERSGRYLVEAALTIELAPERAWVEIPEEDEPSPQDFHLKPAGAIFGEVTLRGLPVVDAGVELYATDLFGDEELVHDTSARNGYFNFYFAPPRDVPLRLTVTSTEGFLPVPLRFTWKGEQLGLGRIDLVPYPTLRIRMRLPDGTYAREVVTCRREDLAVLGDAWHEPARWIGTESRVTIEQQRDVTMRLVFAGTRGSATGGEQDQPDDPGPPFLLERDVDLLAGRPQRLEVIVRPGPLALERRLVDGEGWPLQAVVALGGREATIGEDGRFRIVVPHGGLHTLWLRALHVPGAGFPELAAGAPEHALLLDADDPSDCRLDLAGRILVLAPPCWFRLRAETGRRQQAWGFRAWESAAVEGHLSPPLPAGTYAWTKGLADGAEWYGSVTVDPQRLTVVDAR